jgi:hypothetical protein
MVDAFVGFSFALREFMVQNAKTVKFNRDANIPKVRSTGCRARESMQLKTLFS